MTHKISATLLKRLGEAAYGYRDEKAEIFFLSQLSFPHELEPFDTLEDAERAHRTKANVENWAVFGPYGDTELRAHSGGRRVRSITITFELPGGVTEVKNYDPDTTDAVFLTLAAIEKFAIPYYTRLYGVDFTAEMFSSKDDDGGHIKKTTWIPRD